MPIEKDLLYQALREVVLFVLALVALVFLTLIYCNIVFSLAVWTRETGGWVAWVLYLAVFFAPLFVTGIGFRYNILKNNRDLSK